MFVRRLRSRGMRCRSTRRLDVERTEQIEQRRAVVARLSSSPRACLGTGERNQTSHRAHRGAPESVEALLTNERTLSLTSHELSADKCRVSPSCDPGNIASTRQRLTKRRTVKSCHSADHRSAGASLHRITDQPRPDQWPAPLASTRAMPGWRQSSSRAPGRYGLV